MNKTQYREYLKTPHWKNLRRLCLAKYGQECFVCKKLLSQLDVHHIDYRNIYDVQVDDLRPLCQICHEEVHEYMKGFKKSKKSKISIFNEAAEKIIGDKVAMSQAEDSRVRFKTDNLLFVHLVSVSTPEIKSGFVYCGYGMVFFHSFAGSTRFDFCVKGAQYTRTIKNIKPSDSWLKNNALYFACDVACGTTKQTPKNSTLQSTQR